MHMVFGIILVGSLGSLASPHLIIFHAVVALDLHQNLFIWNITGAQLRHNDFRIFADASRIFTYNCDETFKTTSWNLSEKMPGDA